MACIMISDLVFKNSDKGAKRSLIQYIIENLADFTLIYSPSATVLFCTFCVVASKNFGHIKREVNELMVQKPEDAVNQLDRLKEYYFRNSELVHEISRCFGLILLLEISIGFFSTIFQIVGLVFGFGNAHPWSLLVGVVSYFCLYVINIIIIVFASDSISQEVISNLEVGWC